MLKVIVIVSVIFASALANTILPLEDCLIPEANLRTERIFKGQNTELGEFPYVALLEYSGGIGSSHYSCAGTLINSRYVLTSAYCVLGMPTAWSLDNVILGEWDRSSDPDCITRKDKEDRICSPVIQTIPVEKTIPHEMFNADKTLLNDIALIRLAADVKFNEFVKPICLPQTKELIGHNTTGELFTAIGWGKTEDDTITKQQRKVEVLGISTDVCQDLYKDEKRISITETQICARNENGQDACKDDSGAPLVGIYRDNTGKSYNYLAGIVSAGRGCGTVYPGVYTRVSSFIDWIEKNIFNFVEK